MREQVLQKQARKERHSHGEHGNGVLGDRMTSRLICRAAAIYRGKSKGSQARGSVLYQILIESLLSIVAKGRDDKIKELIKSIEEVYCLYPRENGAPVSAAFDWNPLS